MSRVQWNWAHFTELSVSDLYDILHARIAVFVVEQACPYQDCDGVDRISHHLWTRDERGAIAAYLRVIPPGAVYAEPSIGRVITSASARRTGLGRALVREGIHRAATLYGAGAIRISAQRYLLRFYEEFGFRTTGYHYEEDGIPHSQMVLDDGDHGAGGP
jgi:ElaA protein